MLNLFGKMLTQRNANDLSYPYSGDNICSDITISSPDRARAVDKKSTILALTQSYLRALRTIEITPPAVGFVHFFSRHFVPIIAVWVERRASHTCLVMKRRYVANHKHDVCLCQEMPMFVDPFANMSANFVVIW